MHLLFRLIWHAASSYLGLAGVMPSFGGSSRGRHKASRRARPRSHPANGSNSNNSSNSYSYNNSYPRCHVRAARR